MTLNCVVKFSPQYLFECVEKLLTDSSKSRGLSLFCREAFIDQLESCQVNGFPVDQTLAVGMEYVIVELF
jgi:hypothetical protein